MKKVSKKMETAKRKARSDYNNQFNKENYKQLNIRFSLSKETELIEWLNNFDSPKEYIVTLIKRDIKNANRRKRRNEI